jgi:hypothetical protein
MKTRQSNRLVSSSWLLYSISILFIHFGLFFFYPRWIAESFTRKRVCTFCNFQFNFVRHLLFFFFWWWHLLCVKCRRLDQFYFFFLFYSGIHTMMDDRLWIERERERAPLAFIIGLTCPLFRDNNTRASYIRAKLWLSFSWICRHRRLKKIKNKTLELWWHYAWHFHQNSFQHCPALWKVLDLGVGTRRTRPGHVFFLFLLLILFDLSCYPFFFPSYIFLFL